METDAKIHQILSPLDFSWRQQQIFFLYLSSLFPEVAEGGPNMSKPEIHLACEGPQRTHSRAPLTPGCTFAP